MDLMTLNNAVNNPQAACWLDAAPAGLEDCLQEADREDVRELLANQSCLLGRATTTGTGLEAGYLLLLFIDYDTDCFPQ